MKSIPSFTITASTCALVLTLLQTQSAAAYQNTPPQNHTATSPIDTTIATQPQNTTKKSPSPNDSPTSKTTPEETQKNKSPKPIDMAFMYKGIGKFVTPDDQVKVMDLLESAKTLGPDGAQLILEDIDRRVPNGDGFDFDGIMWSNKDNEFAAIDVYATPGDVPENWPGLIAPPFEFPIKATYLIGSSKGIEWFGKAPALGIRVANHPPSNDRLIAAYVRMYREMVGISRNTKWIQKNLIEPEQGGEIVEKQIHREDDNDLTYLRWDASNGNDHYILIGSWPLNLENNPQTEWVYLRWWSKDGVSEDMRLVHISLWAIEPQKKILPSSPRGLFSFYDIFSPIRVYGIDIMKGGQQKKHMSWDGS